jgi:hypothetical protein
MVTDMQQAAHAESFLTLTDFDYSEYSPSLASSLEQHVQNIEGLTKRYFVYMGKELAEAKAEIHAVKQTGWAKWVEGRLGITRRWADKCIKEYQESGTNFPIFDPTEHGMGASKVVTWNTPQDIVNDVVTTLKYIDIDPASNDKTNPNVPAHIHYTQDENGLLYPWRGKIYLNPPYGKVIGLWTEKLVHDHEEHITEEAIALVPARTDTDWFEPLFPYLICFIHGRVNYNDGDTGAPFPSALVYMGQHEEDFLRVFSKWGAILKRCDRQEWHS